MPTPSDLLEQRLTDAYVAQSALYDQALRALARFEMHPEDDPSLDEVQSILGQVAAVDLALQVDKAAWRDTGRAPGEALRQVLKGLAERIQTLSVIVDERIRAMSAKRAHLLPELDAFVRQRQMLQAYQAAPAAMRATREEAR